MIKIWLEAMRLRTLPVSLSGVVLAVALAMSRGDVRWGAASLCLLFALLAQVASNFANEYYDYVDGIDKKGRAGFRRSVTEGDIKPATLKAVTYATLGVACAVGLALLAYGPWWLVIVGALIAAGVIAYSAGPFPLSHHGLGEVAVFIFYGIIPVVMTYYLVTGGAMDALAVNGAIATGFMGVNVLLVNNIRDVDDDREAHKTTSVVIFGRRMATLAYLLNGLAAMSFLAPVWLYFVLQPLIEGGTAWNYLRLLPLAIYLVLHVATTVKLHRGSGSALNPVLGATARNMLIFTLLLTAALVL